MSKPLLGRIAVRTMNLKEATVSQFIPFREPQLPWALSARKLLLQEIRMQFKHMWASPLGESVHKWGDTVIFWDEFLCVCVYVYQR